MAVEAEEFKHPVFPSKEARDTFLCKLKLLKASRIEVQFSGSGDSGEINDVIFYDSSDKVFEPPGDVVIEAYEASSRFEGDTQTWKREVKVVQKPIKDAIEEVAYSLIESTGLDWCNNDGGQGTLTIFPDEGEQPDSEMAIALEIGINRTVTDDHRFEF